MVLVVLVEDTVVELMVEWVVAVERAPPVATEVATVAVQAGENKRHPRSPQRRSSPIHRHVFLLSLAYPALTVSSSNWPFCW